MSFDVDPRDNIEEYPCDCGGNITKVGDNWVCDKCEFDSSKVEVN